jgi:hypothetical protein
MTSYFLYYAEKVKAPSATRPSKQSIAASWKTLSSAEKLPFDEKAKELKSEYLRQLEAYKNAGGVIAKRKKKSGKASVGEKAGGQKPRASGSCLQDCTEEELLEELFRRGDTILRRLSQGSAPEATAKRRRTAGGKDTGEEVEESGAGRPDGTAHADAGAPPEVADKPTVEALGQAMLAKGAVEPGEEDGFKRWLEARWDKLAAEAASDKPKKIGALGKQKWALLPEAKRNKWSS